MEGGKTTAKAQGPPGTKEQPPHPAWGQLGASIPGKAGRGWEAQMASFILQRHSVHSLPHTQAQGLEADPAPEAGGTSGTCSTMAATDRCHHCLNSWFGWVVEQH